MLYAKHGRHKERVAAAAEGHLHWLTVLYGGQPTCLRSFPLAP